MNIILFILALQTRLSPTGIGRGREGFRSESVEERSLALLENLARQRARGRCNKPRKMPATGAGTPAAVRIEI